VSAARHCRRAELRRARKDFVRAQQRQQAGAAKQHIPAGAPERAAWAWLFPEFEAREVEMRRLLALAGIADGVIYAMVPDEDDRAALLAASRLATVEGEGSTAVTTAAMASSRVALIPVDRRTILQTITTSPNGEWGREAIDLLRSPPPGSMLVVYDGSECGHGVVAIGTMVSRGGSA
jgi:hypothetical protein